MTPGPAGALVATYAAHLLAHDLAMLTEELVELISTTVGDYADLSAVTAGELRESCRRNLRGALDELIGQVPAGEDGDTPQHETGRRRAQQRLPLEALLHSYRLGGRVLWQGLVRRAVLVGTPLDHRRLLDEAGVVWEVIDRHSAIVSRAYREEQGRLLQRTQRRRSGLLSALLEGRGIDAETAREAAAVLGMALRGPRFVVVAALDVPTAEPLPAAEALLEAQGFSSSWLTQARRESGLVALRPGQDPDQAVSVLAACAAGRVAVSPVVDRFDDLGTSYRLADLTLRTLPEGYVGVARVTERLPEALLASNDDVSRILVDQVLGPVLALRPAERDLQLDTLAAMIACDRSYAAAARRLYCHRNTVLKRTQRLEALTGLRLQRPVDLLHLSLALLAVRTGVPAAHLLGQGDVPP